MKPTPSLSLEHGVELQSEDPGLSGLTLNAYFKEVFALSSQACTHTATSEQI